MFAKLLKHEWKNSRTVLGWLSLAALLAGLIGSVLLHISVKGAEQGQWGFGDSRMDAETTVLLSSAITIVLVFLCIGLAVYAVGTQLFLLHRFYKNKFTDQGYLTFTLPVSPRQIFLSSAVNMGIWSLITGLVVVLAAGMMIAGALTALSSDFWREVSYYLGDLVYIWQDLKTEMNPLTLIPLALATWIYGIVIPMTCVTVGAVAAKKHKLLAAFGIYYGVSMASGMVETGLLTALALTGEESLGMMYLCQSGVYLLLAAAGFFLSTYMMKHKLNLP